MIFDQFIKQGVGYINQKKLDLYSVISLILSIKTEPLIDIYKKIITELILMLK